MGHTKLVHGFLEDSAVRFPDKKALFVSGKWETFAELDLEPIGSPACSSAED